MIGFDLYDEAFKVKCTLHFLKSLAPIHSNETIELTHEASEGFGVVLRDAIERMEKIEHGLPQGEEVSK